MVSPQGSCFEPIPALAWPSRDRVFLIDFEEQAVVMARLPDFEYPCKRQYPLHLGQPYHLRVCIRVPRVEVYVDDFLAPQAAIEFPAIPAPEYRTVCRLRKLTHH